MQTDKKLDKYFYITGWIVIALITVLVMIVKINGIGILHKMPPCALIRSQDFIVRDVEEQGRRLHFSGDR